MKVSSMGEPSDLLIDDLELLHQEIQGFSTACNINKTVEIPQTLENYLQFVARSGNTVFPWPLVRSLFRIKMLYAIQQFQEPTCPTESFVLERFDLFRVAAPFTVQRLTELILQPTRHYKMKEKFLRGLEKTVLVVSTIEPRSLTCEDEKNGNDISISSCEGDTDISFSRTFSIDRQGLVTAAHSTSIDVLNQNISSDVSSESIVLDSLTSSAVSTVNVLSQNISVTLSSGGLIGEDITTTDVTAVEVITPDGSITVPTNSIILDTTPEASTLEISMESDDCSTTPMECEHSSVAEVRPANLIQCISEDMVSTAYQQATKESKANTDNVQRKVSPPLVIVDSEDVPVLEESCVVAGSNSPVKSPKLTVSEAKQSITLFQRDISDQESSSVVTPLKPDDTGVTSDVAEVGESTKPEICVTKKCPPAIESMSVEVSSKSKKETVEEVPLENNEIETVMECKPSGKERNVREDPSTSLLSEEKFQSEVLINSTDTSVPVCISKSDTEKDIQGGKKDQKNEKQRIEGELESKVTAVTDSDKVIESKSE